MLRADRFSFIGGINIITHSIFMKIIIVHMLRADWLYIPYMVSVLTQLTVRAA